MKTLFFLKAKCASTHKDFYIRHDFAADDRWVLTYGVKELPSGGDIGGSGMQVDYSSVRVGPQYKCPHCGNVSFIHCGTCGEYTCHPSSDQKECECAHCGNKGQLSDKCIESVEAKNTGSGQ